MMWPSLSDYGNRGVRESALVAAVQRWAASVERDPYAVWDAGVQRFARLYRGRGLPEVDALDAAVTAAAQALYDVVTSQGASLPLPPPGVTGTTPES